MDHPGCVRDGEGVGELGGDCEGLRDREGARPLDTLAEVLAIQELGDEDGAPVRCLEHVEDVDDVRRTEPGQRSRLAPKPPARGIAPGEGGGQHLDGHRAIQASVGPPVEGTHPSAREGRLDAIGSVEDGADEGIGTNDGGVGDDHDPNLHPTPR